MTKRWHENLSIMSKSDFDVKDTVHIWGIKEYNDFRNELPKIAVERKKFQQNLKWLSWEKIEKFIWKSGFSLTDDDFIQFEDWNLNMKCILNDFDNDGKIPGVWYFVEWEWNMYVQPDDSFHEIFPWEWSEDNVKKYLEFSKKLLHELEKLNMKIGDKSKGKLSGLFWKLFE